jgi:hypothetical protein
MTTSADYTSLPTESELPSLPTEAELPVVVPPPSLPAEPGQPNRPLPPDTPSAVLPPPERRDLAAEARWRRSERRGRVMLIESSAQLTLRVKHPSGGDCTVEEILSEERARRSEIERDIATGSKRHHRLPRWLCSVPKWVLGFDFGLLLYFFSGITNVDWTNPLSLALAFAVVLAAMVTLLSYGFLSFTGHRLRSRKNNDGTIFHEDVDGVTVVAFVISVVVIAVLAVLMFTRIRTEVLYALGNQAQVTALVLATAVGVVDAAANFLVISVHALDGSDETAHVDKLSATIREPLNKLYKLRMKAAKLVSN